ncbi:hypothetical protein G647_03360 [Cladophialophora carrionii CBS 160.54]|uniref:Uncharacterized protein n=1 Tax=Cladophialophora carrionii CBS 160.54 TaxID=1279043 RepID=V9DKV7_9EURO|nr:uncharacterized protein G647_03360 [Cladophialophora carrionii CBS 160.54]ETI26582.1 hypothetical protein G647_03360 [Cladophialophora carrionii CBS 160.54]
MDQAATFSSGTGATIASVFQHWQQRAARQRGVQPLSDELPKDPKGVNIQISELQPAHLNGSTPSTPRTPNKPFSEPQLRRWPHEPQPIINDPFVERCLDAVDVIICLLPCILIMKAGLCVLAHEIDKTHVGPSIDKASQLTLRLIEFNSQLTTIFTIIFIVIVSTTVRRYALWKAEKGATIGEIEQLHASISLTATLKAIWSLRRFTFTGLALIFVWSWYYVGSQATTREYSYRDSDSHTTQLVAFLDSKAVSPFSGDEINKQHTSPVKTTDMTARYHMYSSFTAGTQKTNVQGAKSVQGADIYGATLTPWYGPPRGSPDGWRNLDFDDDNWLEISHMSDQPVMSSIGTSLYWRNLSASEPDVWTPQKMVGSFYYEVSNFQANCTAPFLSTKEKPRGAVAGLSTTMNMTAMGPDSTKPRELYFWHWVNDTHSLTSTCEMTNVTLQIDALCTAATCKPTRVRHISTSPRTLLDSDVFATSFFNSMLLACGMPQHEGDFSTFDNDNGLVDLKNQLEENELHDPATLATAQAEAQFPLSMAITRFMNTYFRSSQMLRYEHDIQNDLSVSGSIELNDNPDFAFLAMNGAIYNPQYWLSWPWLAMDIVSNLVLLVAAICAFWLRKHTLAPDIFGFVSSLTRDNPHLHLPEGGSTLSGVERSRAMTLVKVKIADVGEDANVGRVALTRIDGSEQVKDLEKGKTYY